jgi:hypothetical protein
MADSLRDLCERDYRAIRETGGDGVERGAVTSAATVQPRRIAEKALTART